MAGLERFEAMLSKLKAEYAAALPARVGEAAQAWSDHLAGGDIKPFWTKVHGLAGSGTSYGFPEVTRLAGEMDRLVGRAAEQGSPLDPDQRRAVEAGLGELTALAEDVRRQGGA